MRYDQKIALVMDLDGIRSKRENELIHGAQMNWRILTLGVLTAAFTDLDLPMWEMILELARNGILVAFSFWIGFDMMVNRFWLKQGLFYTGRTSKWDRWFPDWKGFFVKIIGITIVILERFGYLHSWYNAIIG